jgi:PhnB protein
VTHGDAISVSVAPESADEGRRIFEALAAGGQVLLPYEHQFWGADYGQCVDRFGIGWQVNYAPTE